jgi:hypothetical protein
MTKAAGRGDATPRPAYHPLNGQDTEEMTEYLTTSTLRSGPLFIIVFGVILRIIGSIRTAQEARQARRVRFDAEFAEMRADMAEVKAAVQAILTTLADTLARLDTVAGRLEAAANRMEGKPEAVKLRIVPAAE